MTIAEGHEIQTPGDRFKHSTGCDRCGGKYPFRERFWVVRGHILCEQCNEEWAAFRWILVETMLEWNGHVVVDQRRRPTKFRF